MPNVTNYADKADGMLKSAGEAVTKANEGAAKAQDLLQQAAQPNLYETQREDLLNRSYQESIRASGKEAADLVSLTDLPGSKLAAHAISKFADYASDGALRPNPETQRGGAEGTGQGGPEGRSPWEIVGDMNRESVPSDYPTAEGLPVTELSSGTPTGDGASYVPAAELSDTPTIEFNSYAPTPVANAYGSSIDPASYGPSPDGGLYTPPPGPEVSLSQPPPDPETHTPLAEATTYTPPPETSFYTPSPEVSTYTPPPEISFYTPSPEVNTYTPPLETSFYTPSPEVNTYTPPPETSFYTPPPEVNTYAPPPSGF
jgi:hypothetical protein